MYENTLLPFEDRMNPNCPYRGLLDEGDIYCYGFGKTAYERYDEHHPGCAHLLVDIHGLGFDDIVARPIQKELILPNYIPAIPHGSGKLFRQYAPKYAAVTLGQIVDSNLKVKPNIRRVIGVGSHVALVVLCYGYDKLLEKIWRNHRDFFKQLVDAGVDLITSVNFSVWDNDPHLERLINIKRSLVTYETMQDLGLNVVPHLYWYGKTDMVRLANWIKTNPHVRMIAINLQTVKAKDHHIWLKLVHQMHEFAELLGARHLSYLITGPQTKQRISDVITALGTTNITFTGGYVAASAGSSRLLMPTHYGLRQHLAVDTDKSILMGLGEEAQNSLIQAEKFRFLGSNALPATDEARQLQSKRLDLLSAKLRTKNAVRPSVFGKRYRAL